MRAPTTAECGRCRSPLTLEARFCGLCGEAVAARGAPIESPSHRREEVAAGAAVAVTDQGARRPRNEDRVAVRTVDRPAPVGTATLCVVCDGVASTEHAWQAAQSAVATGMDALEQALAAEVPAVEASRRAFREARARVVGLAGPDPSSAAPACTYVSVVVTADEVTVGWVGDSRAYWIPDDDDVPRALTVDDARAPVVVDEPGGRLGTTRRSSVITGWLGVGSPIQEAHCTTLRPLGTGLVLACTDGLWQYLSEPEQMAAAVTSARGDDLAASARELVRHALGRGGRDNVTVALLPVGVAS